MGGNNVHAAAARSTPGTLGYPGPARVPGPGVTPPAGGGTATQLLSVSRRTSSGHESAANAFRVPSESQQPEPEICQFASPSQGVTRHPGPGQAVFPLPATA
eukprot:454882-Rhodomonas_salina.1